MLSRLSTAERIAAVGALAGIAASFLTWYGYSSGASTITVNGFRASLLGDIYFIAAVGLVIVIAGRARLLQLGRIDSRAASWCATAAASACVLQFLLVFMAGQSLHKGLLGALIAAAAMVAGTRMRQTHDHFATTR